MLMLIALLRAFPRLHNSRCYDTEDVAFVDGVDGMRKSVGVYPLY